jgi:hypothetical protein
VSPERLLRAVLLQIFYTVGSERLLMDPSGNGHAPAQIEDLLSCDKLRLTRPRTGILPGGPLPRNAVFRPSRENRDVNPRWRLSTGYALMEQTMVNTAASFLSGTGASTDPKHVARAHSQLDLPGKLEFDQWWTSELAVNQIPTHARLDAHLAWPLGESAEIAITGQNLTRPSFLEFADSYGFAGAANPHSIFAQLRWFFYGSCTGRDSNRSNH